MNSGRPSDYPYQSLSDEQKAIVRGIADEQIDERLAEPVQITQEYEVEVIPAQDGVTVPGVPPGWVKYTAYEENDEISAGSKGYKYVCTTAGSTAGSSPSWPDVIGATVQEGGTSTLVWTCAAGNSAVCSAAIDVRNAKSIFLTIINDTPEVHDLKAIISTSSDGEDFDSEDMSEAVVTVDTGEEQKSCAITPGMAYLKVGLFKAYETDTTASSILTIRK